MNKHDVVECVLNGHEPPYVPWYFAFTIDARKRLAQATGCDDLAELLQNHMAWGPAEEGWEDLGQGRWRDRFGVVWDRSVDEDIGVVVGQALDPEHPDDYVFPDPASFVDPDTLRAWCAANSELWRIGGIGFSLYERAWTLVGMEELLCLMIEEPELVHRLLDRICEHNLSRVALLLESDIDAVYFGDDWGDQRGLQMGKALWDTFIRPRLARMYGAVKAAGRKVMIHSCGKVDECFADLVDLGLDSFNPFQPEVMDVDTLLPAWRGRLAFNGGLSTQRTLPYGSPEDVRTQSEHLLHLGAAGGYIFSPAHDVEGDVTAENMLAFIACAQAQTSYQGPKPARACRAVPEH